MSSHSKKALREHVEAIGAELLQRYGVTEYTTYRTSRGHVIVRFVSPVGEPKLLTISSNGGWRTQRASRCILRRLMHDAPEANAGRSL